MFELGSLLEGELGDDDQFTELYPRGDDMFSKLRQIASLSAGNFSKRAVQAQALQQAGYLCAVLAMQGAAP
jgi:hypothetical protein